MTINEDVFLKKLKHTIEPSTKALVYKYIPLALLAGFISLFFCPQFGLSPYKIEPDVLSHWLHQNMFICGLYCGAFLYLTLHLSSFLYFNHYERLQFKKKLSYVPFLLAAMYWLSMWVFSSTDNHYIQSSGYNMGWLMAAGLGLLYSSFYSKPTKATQN